MSEKLSANFIQDAISAYGTDDAELLCIDIIDSIKSASENLPLLRPIRGFQLAVTDAIEDESLAAFADANESKIMLMMNPEADYQTIKMDIVDTIYHEIGHIAHDQRNPRLVRKKKDYLFGAAISEGVAIQAEFSHHVFPLSDAKTSSLEDAQTQVELEKLLKKPGKNQFNRYYDFIFGDESFQSRGYKIGHYVVDAVRTWHSLSLTELMELSLEDYKEFALEELI